jgi:hypothetical protein
MKRYFIYRESRTIERGISRCPLQPKDGYNYEYEAEKYIDKLIAGGGAESLRKYIILKTYTEIND